jgi:hypothetical protein
MSRDIVLALIFFPSALVTSVYVGTHLFMRLFRRRLDSGLMRSLVGLEEAELPPSLYGIAVGGAITGLSQLLVVAMTAEVVRHGPAAGFAVFLGVVELVLAAAWIVLLIRFTSPIE